MKTPSSVFIGNVIVGHVKRRLIPAICSVALLGTISQVSGSIIAYEGFNYTVGSQSVGRTGVVPGWNGGIGWAGPWEDTAPDPNDAFVNPASSTDLAVSDILAGSLSYTDSVGHVLVTSGNMLHNSGTNAAATSRPARNLAAFVITNGTTTWMSFLGKRTGDISPTGFYDRGANFSLFNTNTWGTNTSGRLAFGESSGTATGQSNDTWGVVPLGTGSLRRQSSLMFTNLALVVVRIDHHDDDDPTTTTASTNDFDDLYIWLNPTNLAVQPDISLAFTNILSTETNATGVPTGIDMAFNRVVMFGGNPNASNPGAEWLFDELRIGTTYADVVPFTGGPPANVPARWTSIVPSGGGMSLTITGAASASFTVERSFNLANTNWTSIGNVNLNGSGVGTFNDTDPVATNQARFYRAKQ